ncbi:MAG: hypothetical protein II008_13710 [Oscillospiraceae bacterium]|nr:hypothetical protein [Oscillospiraceae bacterium]
MAINPKALSDDQRNAFTEAYRFYEKFHNMDGTAEDWKQAAEAAGQATARCNGSTLVVKLLFAAWDTIETAQKEREDAARNAPEQTVMMDADGKPVTF